MEVFRHYLESIGLKIYLDDGMGESYWFFVTPNSLAGEKQSYLGYSLEDFKEFGQLRIDVKHVKNAVYEIKMSPEYDFVGIYDGEVLMKIVHRDDYDQVAKEMLEEIKGQGYEIEDYFRVNRKSADKGWRRTNTPKFIMFPSSHDIFIEMVNDYIIVVRKMIAAGHAVLCVTKPNLPCVTRICIGLDQVPKDHFVFRFTIGSRDSDLLKQWEPNAPSFEERFDCLKYAHGKGYRTSISMEPLLDVPYKLIEMITPYVTDGIWIGLMNHLNWFDVPDPEMKIRILILYRESNLEQMVKHLRSNPQIFWMESVMKALL